MSFGQSGPIVGHAIIKALGPELQAAAQAREAAIDRAALDELEVREVEYASMGLQVPVHPTAPRPRRSLLRRLLRR